MNPNSTKNSKLIRQYPFLKTIICEEMEPYGHPFRTLVKDLTINVEKADGVLMYRRARNIGLGDSSCAFQFGGKREDQVMRRGEYIFAVNNNGEIINVMSFPRNDRERRLTLDEPYAWQVLYTFKEINASGTGYLCSDSIAGKTKCLVWVTVEAWYMDTKDDDAPEGRFGKFVDRSLKITIYKKPTGGFSELHQRASVYEHLRLDSRLMSNGAADKDSDILCMNGMLYEMCITFQDEVYFNGMKEILDQSGVRGASGQFGPVKVLCAEMLDYNRVMLEDAVSYVTFQLRPDSKHMYVLAQDGTLPQIRNLVRTVVRMWKEDPESHAAFRPDRNVSVI